MDGQHSGRLLYLVGASGAGKDSLLNYARRQLSADPGVRFARRWITRPAAAGGEDHIESSPTSFLRRSAQGGFAMTWQSHGVHYGIGSEIIAWLALGLVVLVNGSREYLPIAATRFAEIEPILVQVDGDILRTRLIARGREAAQDVERRLAVAARRDNAIQHPRLLCINNDGPLEIAGERLIALIRGEGP